MGEVFEFGKQLRDVLQGLLQISPVEERRAPDRGRPVGASLGPKGQIVLGKYVDPTGLPELFKGELAPSRHVRHQHPPAGIDNMYLKTVDVFSIPGRGQYKVEFAGYFQVTRSEASTPDWATATVYVNFTDLKLFGKHEELGAITVDLNPGVISAGNTFPARDGIPGAPAGAAACAVNVAARFHFEDLNMTVFNKTPVILKNPEVQGIPTIGEGGRADVYALPLYRWNEPDGNLVGYLQELEYQVQNYMTREETMRYRTASSLREFEALAAGS